mgnify:CR=1 FL=1
MQGLHKNQGKAMTEELTSIYEEQLLRPSLGVIHPIKQQNLVVVGLRVTFHVGLRADKGIPALKGKGGKLSQPLFTDFQEFQKFNGPNKLRAIVVEADKLANLTM